MGILDFFKPKHLKIHDDFFGELLYVKVKQPHQNYFEGRCFFKPTNKEIEIAVDGELSGPTQQQKQFFSWIENSFLKLIESIGPFVQREFEKWQPEFSIVNFKREFEPVYLTIPTCLQQPIEWEISFDSIDTSQIVYSVIVEMIGEQPKDIWVST